jgi:hypothetical protein
MRKVRRTIFLFGFGLAFFLLAACAARPETVIPSTLQPTQPPATEMPVPTATAPGPTPTPFIEERFIEVEWPSNLNLGDSDIIRLALIPSESGYTAQLEYPEHSVEVEDVEVPYLEGYAAMAIARLDAVGMDVLPTGDYAQSMEEGKSLSWRWTIYPQSAGRHRISLNLTLRWVPLEEQGRTIEVSLWQTGLEITVVAPFGLSAPQARALGIAGVLVGSVLVLPFAELAARQRLERVRASRVRLLRPNKNLILEMRPDITLSTSESNLLQALFENYARVVVQTRFTSGYSGARTLLVQPFHYDGRADAHTIVKFAARSMIQAEYANYQTFVRQTLPPITGRILGPPVVVRGEDDAVIQYTFVGTPGSAPVSLRSHALEQPAQETARLIEERLFSTFGPAWWMQRRPYVFHLGQEYDRLLPVHLLLETVGMSQDARVISGDLLQVKQLNPGDVVRIEGAMVSEVRAQRRTATLIWPAFPGSSPLRIRYHNIHPASFVKGRKVHGIYGLVAASRPDLLQEEVRKAFPSADLNSNWLTIAGRKLVNPLNHFEDLLHYQLQGTRSVIHGDLNLENILVGPGDLVWLIDFASTREGHTLFDFARLEVELTTQVVAEILSRRESWMGDFLIVLDELHGNVDSLDGPLGEIYLLLNAVRSIARRCFYDPADSSEFYKALLLAYLGCLKFTNLDQLSWAPMSKALAFLAAAYLMEPAAMLKGTPAVR